jgi:hypothetical protein
MCRLRRWMGEMVGGRIDSCAWPQREPQVSNRESHDLAMTSSAPAKHYLAHVHWNEDGSFVIHELEEHLRAVGDLGIEGPW